MDGWIGRGGGREADGWIDVRLGGGGEEEERGCPTHKVPAQKRRALPGCRFSPCPASDPCRPSAMPNFAGIWKMKSSENFDELLKVLGKEGRMAQHLWALCSAKGGAVVGGRWVYLGVRGTGTQG